MIHDPSRLLLLLGPCTLESENVCRSVAEVLVDLRTRHPEVNLVFKGSFDKANRTSVSSARGPGMEQGLELLGMVKADYGLPTVTDVHLPEQCARVAEAADVIQIPAFLCRQTDLLVAAAATGRTVNAKKGQFLSPPEMQHVVTKLEEAGATEIWQTERGTTFGYQNLVVDMRSFPILGSHGRPALIDATHSVQQPGAPGGVTGGQREFVAPLARAALAAGADGVFLETHPDPDNAVSDAASQVPLDELQDLVESLLRIWQAAR